LKEVDEFKAVFLAHPHVLRIPFDVIFSSSFSEKQYFPINSTSHAL